MMLQVISYDKGKRITGSVLLTSLPSCGKKMMPQSKPPDINGKDRVWIIGSSKYDNFLEKIIKVSDEFYRDHSELQHIAIENIYAYFGLMHLDQFCRGDQWALVLSDREFKKGETVWAV